MKKSTVLIIGGGPAGTIAALTLLKLGHNVKLYERFHFPRYRIGESLLPGTMSILCRLGLKRKIEEEGYIRKPSATFLWGQNQAPWTFSFSIAPQTDWIYDHAIQVKREEFDHMLFEEVRSRGGEVTEGAKVTDVRVEFEDHVEIDVDYEDATETVRGDYLIDASGSNSLLVKKLDCRRYDEFYRSLAVWSYFKRKEPFSGDLKGTTFSLTFQYGWCWMIPLKGDMYSVGVIVDQSHSQEINKLGKEEFYRKMLGACKNAMKILGDAEQIDEVRITRDWSYDTTLHSKGRFFLCGDSACFTDPLFSQGVHLAAQSAVSAAAAIDRLSHHPDEENGIHRWYGKSYSLTFEQYHEFLASFYTFASFREPESEFWNKRKISETDDQRLERRKWFNLLVGKAKGADKINVVDFKDRASAMIALGTHDRQELSDEFSDSELLPKRTEWLAQLAKKLNSISALHWVGNKVLLEDYYKVNPFTFELEPKYILANEEGKSMTKHAVSREVGQLFSMLRECPIDYPSICKALGEAGAANTATQMIIRLFEAGLLKGFDKDGNSVHIQERLRFDGVGVEYEV